MNSGAKRIRLEDEQHKAKNLAVQKENIVPHNYEFSDDDFEWDHQDFEQILAAPAPETTVPPPKSSDSRYYNMVVKSVALDQNSSFCKVLTLSDRKSPHQYIAKLQDDWFALDVAENDAVNIIGQFDSQGYICITSDHNLIVLKPEVLLTGTMVSTSFACIRRSVLNELTSGSSSAVMVIGTLLHELFQECVLLRQITDFRWENLEIDAKRVINRHLLDIYAANMTENQALDELKSASVGFKWFHDSLLVAHGAKENLRVNEHRGAGHSSCSITKILDIEESITSPMYGIKGNIDATIELEIRSTDKTKQVLSAIAPLEIKTGKNNFQTATSISHRAQTSLYTLMLSDRYAKGVEYGLLFYLRSSEVLLVPNYRDEIRGLIMARNRLAKFVSDKENFPPVLRNNHMCKKCYAVNICATVHKTLEQGDHSSFGIDAADFDWQVGHIEDDDMKFVQKWFQLLNQEDKFAIKNDKSDRKHEFIVDSCLEANQYRLISPECSIFETSISVSDHIIISLPPNLYGFASGFVESVSEKYLTIRCDKPLKAQTRIVTEKKRLSFGSSLLKRNIINLISDPDNQILHRLKSCVIGKQFDGFTKDIRNLSNITGVKLNAFQEEAIIKCINMQHFALIFGMPGTGKTSTIVSLIMELMALGKSIIIASYTNSALDNVLCKLKQFSKDFIRIGSKSKVVKELHEFCLEGNSDINNLEDLETKIQTAAVVGVTCYGVNHPLFGKRSFDYCIIDEAAQILLPASLGPLMLATKFVLVGDPFQLPPVVVSKEATEAGLAVSLFEELYNKFPESVIELKYQYRMNQEIMNISNSMFYQNRLLLGSNEVGQQRLRIDFNLMTGSDESWIRSCLDPRYSVVFLNTDISGDAAKEVRTGSMITNPFEAKQIQRIISTLTNTLSFPQSEIAVISQYRSQLTVLKDSLKNAELKDVEVHTVDRFQGRDKDVIIMSMVRSNDENMVGDLLKDWRRLNVAITRARCKLIFIGSVKTLKEGEELYAKLLKHVNKVINI